MHGRYRRGCRGDDGDRLDVGRLPFTETVIGVGVIVLPGPSAGKVGSGAGEAAALRMSSSAKDAGRVSSRRPLGSGLAGSGAGVASGPAGGSAISAARAKATMGGNPRYRDS